MRHETFKPPLAVAENMARNATSVRHERYVVHSRLTPLYQAWRINFCAQARKKKLGVFRVFGCVFFVLVGLFVLLGVFSRFAAIYFARSAIFGGLFPPFFFLNGTGQNGGLPLWFRTICDVKAAPSGVVGRTAINYHHNFPRRSEYKSSRRGISQ